MSGGRIKVYRRDPRIGLVKVRPDDLYVNLRAGALVLESHPAVLNYPDELEPFGYTDAAGARIIAASGDAAVYRHPTDLIAYRITLWDAEPEPPVVSPPPEPNGARARRGPDPADLVTTDQVRAKQAELAALGLPHGERPTADALGVHRVTVRRRLGRTP